MTSTTFFAYVGTLAMAMPIPGPQSVALLAQLMRYGWRSATFMVAGMVSGGLMFLNAVLG